MTNVGVYLRISEDRTGAQTATARQLAECQRVAASNGWTVGEVFEDVDLSASKRGVVRPAFERLIQAVTAREVDGVLAWRQDRLQRSLRDFVRLNEACDIAGAFIVTMDGVDTRSLGGKILGPILTVVAAAEAANTSSRVRNWHASRAKAGKPAGGGQRAFGYSVGRREIIESEAQLIREAAQRVFNGESIRSIHLDWARRGVKTPTGKTWAPQSLRRMLIGWALAGIREYEGVRSAGTWQGILKAEETERLRVILMDTSRQNAGLRAARSYLLTGGVAHCGRCGEALIGRPGYRNARRYTCAKRPGSSACGGIARVAEPVERLVAQMMFEALRGVDVSRFVESGQADESDTLLTTIRDDETALVELAADHYERRVIGRTEFFTIRGRLQARIEANRRTLAQASRAHILGGMTDIGTELERRWDRESLDWRRTVVAALIESVTIHAALPGRAVFDPSAVEVRWKF